MPLKPLNEIGRGNRRGAFPLNVGRQFVKVNGSVPHNRMLFLFLILSGRFRSSLSSRFETCDSAGLSLCAMMPARVEDRRFGESAR